MSESRGPKHHVNRRVVVVLEKVFPVRDSTSNPGRGFSESKDEANVGVLRKSRTA
jgi:hypothetical protein